jgi:hypothetical protein
MKNLYPYPLELCRQAIYRHRKYLERLRTPLDSPQSRHLPPKLPLSLQTPRFNVWKLFRLGRGSEKRFLVVKLPNGKVTKKTLHFCLLCERKRIPESWSDSYTGNAQDHLQREHVSKWKEIYRSLQRSMVSVNDTNQLGLINILGL